MTQEDFKSILGNFRRYAAKFLRIKNKAGLIVPFLFNTAQTQVHETYEKAVADGKRLWFIVLKARQEGVSTYWEGLFFRDATTIPNLKCQIVGHKNDAANNLFEMVKRYYLNLPEAIQPEVERSNEKKLGFGKLKSEILIASAEAGEDLKRSDTLQRVHATEVAFWRDAKKSMLALLQTASDPSTIVVVESTANGIGDWFYDTWKDAVEGLNDFIPIFLAWFTLPEYSKAFSSDAERNVFVESLSDEELELGKAFTLSLEQLHWRRWAIDNLCSKDVDQFRQEYPSTWQEAFLTSGRPVFNPDLCRANLTAGCEPFKRGDLTYTDETKTAVTWTDNPRGFISLWYDLQLKKTDVYRFAAGCDVAEGLEQGDYNYIPILDRKNGKVAVSWHGHLHPDLLAEEQHKLSLFLGNDLWFCTERNNHGLTTIVVAHQLHVKEYYEENFQAGYALSTDKLGFKTNIATKPLLINSYIPAVRDGLFRHAEAAFWDEHLTFVRNAHGQMQAQGKDKDPGTKCFDDRVMGGGLMWHCHQWLPAYVDNAKPEEPAWLKDFRAKAAAKPHRPGAG